MANKGTQTSFYDAGGPYARTVNYPEPPPPPTPTVIVQGGGVSIYTRP